IEQLNPVEIVENELKYELPSFSFGKWYKQPVAPVIWVEKDAIARNIKNFLSGWSCPIVVSKGYTSWSMLYKAADTINRLLNWHDKVVVLYIGDLDPSGVDIQRFVKEALGFFIDEIERVEVKRIAITPEQVEKYNLPPKPEDAETLAKLKRDTRSKKYTYDYVVEVDALLAFVPDEFKKLVVNSVKELFNQEIYDELKKEAAEYQEKAKKLVEEYKKKALIALYNKLRELVGGET
ncbi:MAG: hypothetical protein DRJ03_08060, partial [Chloroflexi bacterium]